MVTLEMKSHRQSHHAPAPISQHSGSIARWRGLHFPFLPLSNDDRRWPLCQSEMSRRVPIRVSASRPLLSMERASQLQRSDIHRAMGLSGRQDRRIEGSLLVHGLSPLSVDRSQKRIQFCGQRGGQLSQKIPVQQVSVALTVQSETSPLYSTNIPTISINLTTSTAECLAASVISRFRTPYPP